MSYDKSQAARQFTGWSGCYDRSILQWLLFGPAHKAIVSRLQARCGDRALRILDVGCGTGVFASVIATALPRATVFGVDLVAGMLAGGRERWLSLREKTAPVQGDSERLPFADGVFDVVTCANSFHHYPHQDRAVSEMHRVLKSGGRLFLVDGCRDGVWGWFIYDVCVPAVEGNVQHASAARMRALLHSACFAEVTQKAYRGPAPFLLTEGAARPVRTTAIRSWAGFAPRTGAEAVSR